MSRPTPPALSVLLLAVCGTLCGVLVGCGKDAPPDREQVNAVYERVMRSLHAADWEALQRDLTKDARFTLERDMKRFSRRLGHPEDGKREREIARARLGEGADEAMRLAAQGGVGEALAFFLRLSPRAEVPPRRRLKLGKFQAEMFYALADGTQHLVRFVRGPEGWYVSELHL